MKSDNDIVTIIVPDNFRVKADGGLEEYWESQRSNHKMAMHLHIAKTNEVSSNFTFSFRQDKLQLCLIRLNCTFSVHSFDLFCWCQRTGFSKKDI